MSARFVDHGDSFTIDVRGVDAQTRRRIDARALALIEAAGTVARVSEISDTTPAGGASTNVDTPPEQLFRLAGLRQ